MPHRYIGDRPPVKVNYTYGAGGSISSGQRYEEPVWVPIEIQREGRDEHWARKKKPDYYKQGAYRMYSSGAGGSIPSTQEYHQYEAPVRQYVEEEKPAQRDHMNGGQEDQMWPRKKRSDLRPAM